MNTRTWRDSTAHRWVYCTRCAPRVHLCGARGFVGESHPSLRPVELFKDILEVLHGPVRYQHDGLVTQAALAQRCRLNTHTDTHKHTPSVMFASNAVCAVVAAVAAKTGTNLVEDLERLLHGVFHLALSFDMKLLNQKLEVLPSKKSNIQRNETSHMSPCWRAGGLGGAERKRDIVTEGLSPASWYTNQLQQRHYNIVR